jgi:hypothetical protein
MKRPFDTRFRARKVVGILALVAIGIFAFGSIVMLLWNSLMPALFHLPIVDFWQALGLFALAKILFSSFRGHPRGRWKAGLNERWTNMTPEEREKLKEKWGRRCAKPFPEEDLSDPAKAEGKQ